MDGHYSMDLLLSHFWIKCIKCAVYYILVIITIKYLELLQVTTSQSR